jgi:hypothetical protein
MFGLLRKSGFLIRIDLMRIRIQLFFLIADPDPVFDDLKLKKFTDGNLIFYFLDKKLPFTYP